jgi:phosphate transport system substrate-binding protein
MASYVLMRKVSDKPDRSREVLKYFKYSLRYGGLSAVQFDYVPMPESVSAVVMKSWSEVVDGAGVPVFKD